MRLKLNLGISIFLLIGLAVFLVGLMSYINSRKPLDEVKYEVVQGDEPIPPSSGDILDSETKRPEGGEWETSQARQVELDRSQFDELSSDDLLDRIIEEAIYKAAQERYEKLEEKEDIEHSPDYSEYDRLFEKMVVWIEGERFEFDLNMIGIPIDITHLSNVRVFKPTERERERIEELEKEAREIFLKYGFDPDASDFDLDRFYLVASPQDARRVREIGEQLKRLHERAVRPDEGARAFYVKGPVRYRLPDGTRITWYRRKDGALIREVVKPDGEVLKFIAGWVDLNRFPPDIRREIIRNAREE